LEGYHMHEALDTPSLSLLTWDMPKILLRIAIVLVLGPFVSTAKAKVMIQVDLDAQQMTVTKNNSETYVWKVSSGREGFETPTGLFSVQRLDANHFSDEYDQSPMPYSIFFDQGLAIHGTYQGGLGRPASHGCVRLAIPHARMLYSWVKQYGASIEISGTAIEILDPTPTPTSSRSVDGRKSDQITLLINHGSQPLRSTNGRLATGSTKGQHLTLVWFPLRGKYADAQAYERMALVP
jgi:L,D-transpeptidase catalytic domain